MKYPGGKGKSYPHLINLLPPHRVYIETHLGGGAVLRKKQASASSIAIDKDASLIDQWQLDYPHLAQYITGDAADYLSHHAFVGDELVYCDPPYLPATRKRQKIYRHEYSEEDHCRLLKVLLTLPCNVMISGYRSTLYDSILKGWNTHTFSAKAHDGLRTECVWFNYPLPVKLHDTRFLGDTFREREVIKRRLGRIKQRIGSLSLHERHHLSDWLRASTQLEASP